MEKDGGEEEVVRLEDAVELLVEHLVAPVLPLGRVEREEALSPETQEAVARQVHATVVLYNYYHRKQFPQLEFASPDRFRLSIRNRNLLRYITEPEGAGLSVTDRAIIDACDIAEALDPTKDSPETFTWPISKVAVLLVNQRKKVCLLQHGSQTKGIWSIFEKDVKTDMSVQGLSNKPMALPSEPYALQQIAYSEVELRTGLKRTNLRFIEEHRVYSLSKKGTTTMLFVLDYDQAVDSKLKEMPLGALIERMSGPIFESGSYPITSSVVECYHLLPYKDILLNVLNRLMTPKKKKKVIKEVADSGPDNCTTSKKRKDSKTNCKRKSEAFKTKVDTYAEHGDGQIPTKDLQGSAQMDKDRTNKSSKSRNVPQQDVIPTPDVDPVVNNHSFENQHEEITEKSGKAHVFESHKEKITEKPDCISAGITCNTNVQKYATMLLLQKMRDDTLREQFVLGDRSAEYEMEIQTILTETEMTPKVVSILKKYENSCKKMMEFANPISSGKGWQPKILKRKKLKEAILLRNKCQELEDVCHESNWNLPRYIVLPSATGDMYKASVHLSGPDFNLTSDGDMKVTPHEARDSAASNMLSQLQQKARED